MSLSIALIGYGAIATEVVKGLAVDEQIRVAQVLVRPARAADVQAALGPDIDVISTPDDIAADTDFVLECAGHDAVRAYGPKILAQGIDLGVISVGALADPAVQRDLETACAKGGARLSILSGAIGGIDALAAAGNQLDRVSYVSRKPPMSWSGSPAEETHDLRAITSATEIFTGSARAAASGFPKNANVVATVALAGIGFDRTTVSLVADPSATGNTHHITAQGALFDFSYSTSGAALPSNPKTSALTALSALRAVRARGIGLVI